MERCKEQQSSPIILKPRISSVDDGSFNIFYCEPTMYYTLILSPEATKVKKKEMGTVCVFVCVQLSSNYSRHPFIIYILISVLHVLTELPTLRNIEFLLIVNLIVYPHFSAPLNIKFFGIIGSSSSSLKLFFL
jgi:hypothetical protein